MQSAPVVLLPRVLESSEPESCERRNKRGEPAFLREADRAVPVFGEGFKRGSRRSVRIAGLFVVDMPAYRAAVGLHGREVNRLGYNPAAGPATLFEPGRGIHDIPERDPRCTCRPDPHPKASVLSAGVALSLCSRHIATTSGVRFSAEPGKSDAFHPGGGVAAAKLPFQ